MTDNTLRFFIYWKGQDIDLSATFHDENFKKVSHVSYTRLKNGDMNAYHSGDITYAPDGASEFIDIEIESALEKARYVVMNVLVYSGPTFAEHEICYAGWMTREKPKSNEIYDPQTVVNKIDVVSESKNCIPVVFDMQERKAIWADLVTRGDSYYGGNNVESNIASIEETLEMIVKLKDTKITLGELFTLHGLSRGLIVDNKEDADIVFGLFGGDVKATDIMEINSQYIA